MIEIHTEGTQFEYCSFEGATEDEMRELDFGIDEATVKRLKNGNDTRLVIFRNFLPPNQRLPYWLVWQNPRDLFALDEKVRIGTYSARDFALALRTVPQRTRCFNCGREFRTLVVDAGDPYCGAPHLHREKIAKLKVLPCPNCGSSLRQLVTKFIDQ